MGASAVARTFYRIVRTNPPTLIDFTPPAVLGQVPFSNDPAKCRLQRGLSAYATEAQARRKARISPMENTSPLC